MSTEIVKQSDTTRAFKANVAKMEGELVKALNDRIPVEYFTRVLMTTVQQNPGILKCSMTSIMGAVMEGAQLGLEIDGVLGHGYLVPFKGKCTFIAGYKGLIQLGLGGGGVKKIVARPVYEGDEFELLYGFEDRITHKPMFTGGKLEKVYAMALLANGETSFVVMDKREVEVIRKRAPSGNSPAWRDDYEAMALKTAVRKLFRWLPLSSDATRAAAKEEQLEVGALPVRDTEAEVVDKEEAMNPLDILAASANARAEEMKKEEEAEPEPEAEAKAKAQDRAAEDDRDEELGRDQDIPWDEALAHGGYPFPVFLRPAYVEWSEEPIGGRTSLRGVVAGILSTSDNPEVREKMGRVVKDAGQRWSLNGKQPTDVERRFAIVLRMQMEHAAKEDPQVKPGPEYAKEDWKETAEAPVPGGVGSGQLWSNQEADGDYD
jgi:recombination protein RecT